MYIWIFKCLLKWWVVEYYIILIHKVKGIKPTGLEAILDNSLNWFLVGSMSSLICISNNSRLMYSSTFGLGSLILFAMFSKSRMSLSFTTRTSPPKFPSTSSNYEWWFLLLTMRFSYCSFFNSLFLASQKLEIPFPSVVWKEHTSLWFPSARSQSCCGLYLLILPYQQLSAVVLLSDTYHWF